METKLLGVQLGVFLLIWGLFTCLGKLDQAVKTYYDP